MSGRSSLVCCRRLLERQLAAQESEVHWHGSAQRQLCSQHCASSCRYFLKPSGSELQFQTLQVAAHRGGSSQSAQQTGSDRKGFRRCCAVDLGNSCIQPPHSVAEFWAWRRFTSSTPREAGWAISFLAIPNFQCYLLWAPSKSPPICIWSFSNQPGIAGTEISSL